VIPSGPYRYRTGVAWRDLPTEFAGPGYAVGDIDWTVSIDSTINRTHQHAATLPGTQGEPANHTNLATEPADHAIGRSRGGLSTKIHHAGDGRGRPLAVLIGPGQGGDAPRRSP